jgi:hypothetical protein
MAPRNHGAGTPLSPPGDRCRKLQQDHRDLIGSFQCDRRAYGFRAPKVATAHAEAAAGSWPHDPPLRIGYLLAVLVEAAGVYGAIILLWGQSARSPQVTVGGQWRLLAIIYGLLLLGTAVHELGHLLAAWMLSEKVTEVHIGSPPSVLRVRAVGVVWHLGPVPRGRVRYGSGAAVPDRRDAVFRAAGPLANLLTAAVALAIPAHGPVKYSAALIFAVSGLANCSRSGPSAD